ncbi:RidA family protein [Polaribacter cellanae]|uniref:RidA family protein n=1 Tax=Polaribacter cellanae TaxID=2818493 RepID=A0A975H699_9FLAO|nr:RidA family protein [Polaribacter cellanae]QTE21689.1 RidA family protein [Polaribacter cellanae]
MNAVENKLKALGFKLPTPKPGVGAYKSWTIFSNNIVCTSGQIPWNGNDVAYTGRLGDETTIEYGFLSAQLCALHAIAQLKEAVNGDLTKIKQIIRVEGNIYTAPKFSKHAEVLDGASNLFNAVFGEKGIHTRTAQGINSSPLNATTLIYVFAEIEKDF